MKIAEVSERYGLSADTLRYYERVGLIPRSPEMTVAFEITTNWISDGLSSLSA